jgi:hypothetical protein
MKTSNVNIANIIMVENFGWAKAFAKGNDYDYGLHMFGS